MQVFHVTYADVEDRMGGVFIEAKDEADAKAQILRQDDTYRVVYVSKI